MADYYECHKCRKLSPILSADQARDRCPLCGGPGGEIRSQDQAKQGREAGVYFNIDPATGKRAKKKRR